MRNSKHIAIVLLALSYMTQSCGKPEYLSEVELGQYILDESNGVIKEVSSNGVVLKAIYHPTDLLVAQEMKTVAAPTDKAIEDIRNKYKNHYYFIVSLSKDGKEVLSPAAQGMAGFSSLLQTLSFGMAEKVNLTTPTDTIFVADYIYNRTFGLSNSTDLLFVFEKAKAQGQESVQLNVEEFGLGLGSRALSFSTSALDNCPKIYKTPNPQVPSSKPQVPSPNY
jgi:hypothetical protein